MKDEKNLNEVHNYLEEKDRTNLDTLSNFNREIIKSLKEFEEKITEENFEKLRQIAITSGFQTLNLRRKIYRNLTGLTENSKNNFYEFYFLDSKQTNASKDDFHFDHQILDPNNISKIYL